MLVLPTHHPPAPGAEAELTLELAPVAARFVAATPEALGPIALLVTRRYGVDWPVLGAGRAKLVAWAWHASAETVDVAAFVATPPTSYEARVDDARPAIAVDLAGGGWRALQAGVVWAIGVAHDGSGLDVLFDAQAVDRPTAQRMAEHVALVLDVVVTTPRMKVSAVTVLLAEERRQLLHEWNAPAPDDPVTTLDRLFREQVARSPDAVALVGDGRTMTYGQLDAASERVAAAVRPDVARPGDLVFLSGERSPELFAAIIGVIKTGAGFCYVDPSLPPQRLDAMLNVAAPVVCLSTESGASSLGDDAQAVEALLARPAGDSVPALATPESTAYVIFTSGSTGEPEAVLRPHRMHTSRIYLEQRMYPMGASDRHLLKSPISFRELFWPLASGGTAIIARPGGDRDDRYLSALIDDAGITTVSFVPSMLRLLLRQPRFREAAALRHIFVGGEPLPLDLETAIRALGAGVHNTYTLTEADYVAHRTGPVGPLVEPIRGTLVGRPLDMRVYLCDDDGRLVPPGVPGEVYTGGPGLAAGYLGRPELNAERFVANTIEPDGAPRLFRTGDLARFRRDGQLEHLGRIDGQVKVRGNRVEPVEIERVLRAVADVADAAVVPLPDNEQGTVLAAYVVVVERAGPTVADLRRAVGASLPEFMVPSYFAIVSALPLLDSGKLDMASLRVRTARRPVLGVPFRGPEDDGQQLICELVAQVVGVEAVGADDDFFAVGGDSLRLMLLRAAIEARAGRSLGLAELLDTRTPRRIARLLDPEQEAPAPEATLAGRSDQARRRAALQRRIADRVGRSEAP